MRVCQFRHDGNLNCNAAAAARPPNQEDQHFYFTGRSQRVKQLMAGHLEDERQISPPETGSPKSALTQLRCH